MSNSAQLAKSRARNDTQDIVRVSRSPFSVLSPYLITGFSIGGDPTVPDLDVSREENSGYESNYLKAPSLHSLPEEMPSLIRKELQIIFFEETALHLRHQDTYKTWWRRDGTMTCVRRRHLPARGIAPRDVIQFLNKEILVYFESISVDADDGAKIARYIYREWLRLHHGRPPFQRDGFFAKAVQISDKGPRNLQQLSTFHKGLCQQLSTHLDDLVDFYPSTWSKAVKPPFFEPVPSRKIQSWRDHGYIMRHLFRALYMVVDSQALAEPAEPGPARQDHDKWIFYHEGVSERSLARCTVLLVKTGDEAHLDAPISFLPLFDAGLASHVDRQDYSGAFEETAVRVKLDVAVRFVRDLLRKEEEALDDIGRAAQELRDEQETFCKAWVDKVMTHSHEVGLDNNGYAWVALRRALARMNSEAFDQDQVHPLWESLRIWM
ncbi:hypothetical protein FZEAL_7163 [Fusarium zealandicum]|uniref:Uncharacterized protein n=1 Tax=Fusarium zealandicum TaxID=1053134 RepID=A0A8H4UGI7_9HYPO|nr:hypothetical protein FZEAL_7163 [Fusarium zealandicum]